MTVTVHLHPEMSYLADNLESLSVEGNTIEACVDRVIERYPDLKDLIFHKDGGLQTYLEIYLNRKAVIPNDLRHSVHPGDDVHLIMAIVGG